MASIFTAIELQDNFSSVMDGIYNSVSMSTSAMDNLNNTMGQGVDISSMESAAQSIDRATESARGLGSAMSGLWLSGGMDIFSGSGVGRYTQELYSAHNALNRMSSAQARITSIAKSTDILPPGALVDLDTMGKRIDSIRERIIALESNTEDFGFEQQNAEVEALREKLSMAERQQRILNQAVQNMDVGAASMAYAELAQTIDDSERHIRDNIEGQRQFNREIEKGTQGASGLLGMIAKMAGAYLSIRGAGAVMGMSDQLASATARLDMMNDGLQETSELQDMIYAAAERSRGSYNDMMSSVAKLGNLAGDAFSSSAEVVQFAEQLQKQFVLAGAGTTEIQSATLQLTQALASGVLRGDELNSVMEQAPTIVQAIADYMGVATGEVRELASQGKITANIVKNAMFAAADETNERFEAMPKTFAQAGEQIKNHALKVFEPLLEKVGEFADSAEFETMINGLMNGITVFGEVAGAVFDAVANGASFVVDNWSMIAPIVTGAAIALGVYKGALLATKAAEVAANVAKGVMAATTGALSAATGVQTTAQWSLNAAMYACPLVWIVGLILLLIGLIYLAVAAFNKFSGETISATGVVLAMFAIAGAFIGNIFIASINFVIDIIVVLWNFIADFANFFGNVFDDPIGAIVRLFHGMADSIFAILQAIASAIDTLFGSNLAGALQGFRDTLSSKVTEVFGEGKEIMAKVDAADWHLDRFSYTDVGNDAYAAGEGFDKFFDPASLLDGLGGDGQDKSTKMALPTLPLEEIANNTGGTAGNTAAMADAMGVSSEELKYLRDIAEQEAINRFTTAEVNIDMSGMQNTVNNSTDLDGFMRRLTDAVHEVVDTTAKGVYA